MTSNPFSGLSFEYLQIIRHDVSIHKQHVALGGKAFARRKDIVRMIDDELQRRGFK